MLPTIRIGALEVTRLIIGGNPFSGFSHQSPERDNEMVDYYTTERIKETLRRAEAAGLNAMVLRYDDHIRRLLREYTNEGGTLQWIAQMGYSWPEGARMVDAAVANGAKAAFIHGGVLDDLYGARDARRLSEYVEHVRSHGIPVGIAGHSPEAHLWAHEMGLPLDFQMVCFYNCGSLHSGKGDRFDPADVPPAVDAIRRIPRPCLGYKILGAGRVPARQAFEYAFRSIKDTDAVVVGMYRGDNDDMVEENARLTAELLAQTR